MTIRDLIDELLNYPVDATIVCTNNGLSKEMVRRGFKPTVGEFIRFITPYSDKTFKKKVTVTLKNKIVYVEEK